MKKETPISNIGYPLFKTVTNDNIKICFGQIQLTKSIFFVSISTKRGDSMGQDKIFWDAISYVYLAEEQAERLHQHDSRIAPSLISFFYNLFPHPYFDLGLKSFKNKYILNETEIEQTGNETDDHSKIELQGMASMYNYIEHFDFETDDLTIYELKELHKLLYSKAPHPEAAGNFRNHHVHLAETRKELTAPENINREFYSLGKEFDSTINQSINHSDDLLNYIRNSVITTTKLMQIHPFHDGNGRSIRGLLNLMFKQANIPPVYVVPKEKEVYHKALDKAHIDIDYGAPDYSEIVDFYFYKICDSLIEISKTNTDISIGNYDKHGVKIYQKTKKDQK